MATGTWSATVRGFIGELQSRLGVDLGVTLLDDADIEVLKGVTSDIHGS